MCSYLNHLIEYTQYTVFNIKMKISLYYPTLQPRDFFLGTHGRVRNSRGKRAISVRAIEVQLYYYMKITLAVVLRSLTLLNGG